MVDKKILFIGIGFYEYDQKILQAIRTKYEVDYFCEEPTFNILEKFLCKSKVCIHRILQYKLRKIKNKILNNIREKKYDEIFIIKSERLDEEFYLNLKKINENIKLKLYLWDDIARLNNFFKIKKYFNEIYTFDLEDAKKYNLKFEPLFYLNEFEKNINIKKIDIYFSGWGHSDRIAFLEKILDQLQEKRKKIYMYITLNKNLFIYKKFFRKNIISQYIHHKNLSLTKNIYNTINSKILIDIQHISQKGLTLRTIEALGAKCKIITTNKEIKKYDFYNEDNILIIDRENPKINFKFLEKPYKDIDIEIYQKYSLTKWVERIFL